MAFMFIVVFVAGMVCYVYAQRIWFGTTNPKVILYGIVVKEDSDERIIKKPAYGFRKKP